MRRDVSLLFLFTFFIMLAVLAVPRYLKWHDADPLISDLRRIHKAQVKYRDFISVKKNFGSFRELVAVEQLPDNCPGCAAHLWANGEQRFELSRNYEESRFCVKAFGTRTLALDADGKIYESESNRLDCQAGEVVGDRLRETR